MPALRVNTHTAPLDSVASLLWSPLTPVAALSSSQASLTRPSALNASRALPQEAELRHLHHTELGGEVDLAATQPERR